MKITTATFLKSAQYPKDYPSGSLSEVAFAGRSNVGKSSMMNTLLGRRNLVKISKTPGHTRILNFFLINEEFVLVDFPGYGFAKVPLKMKERWAEMVETYLDSRKQLAGIVTIVDARHFPTDSDMQLLEYLESKNIPVILAATKTDKLTSSQLAALPARIRAAVTSDFPIVLFSSHNGNGRNELWKEIKKLTKADASLKKADSRKQLEKEEMP